MHWFGYQTGIVLSSPAVKFRIGYINKSTLYRIG